MKNLKLTLILSVLSLATTAFADISGTYEVIKPDCNDFIFSQSRTAEVIADNTNFKVGFMSHYSSPDGSPKLIAGFDYKVGVTKDDCRLGECQNARIGTYSKDKNQFVHLFLQSETSSSIPVIIKQVTFTLSENELSIVNGQKECLFKKL